MFVHIHPSIHPYFLLGHNCPILKDMGLPSHGLVLYQGSHRPGSFEKFVLPNPEPCSPDQGAEWPLRAQLTLQFSH